MLCPMFLNVSIADNEKPYGIYSPTFVADNYSGIFLHHKFFLSKIQNLRK